MRKRIAFFAAFLAIGGTLFCSPASFAMRMTPSAMDMVIDPGATMSQAIDVENTKDIPVTMRASIVGVTFGDSAEDLRFGDLPEPWRAAFHLAPEEMTLVSGTQGKFIVTVTAPLGGVGAEGTVAGVLVEEVGNGTDGVAVLQAATTLVFVRSSAASAAPLTPTVTTSSSVVSGGAVDLFIDVRNTGDIVAIPRGEVAILTSSGRAVATFSLNDQGQRVPAHTTRRFFATWARPGTGAVSWLLRTFVPMGMGEYRVQLTLADGTLASARMILIPWKISLLFLIVIFAVIGILRGVCARWRLR